MKLRHVVLALTLIPLPSLAAVTPFVGQNCQLAAPPAEAGEDNVSNQALKIFPRKKTLAKDYSGCLTVWAPTVKGYSIVGTTKFAGGKPAEFWSPYDKAPCKYTNGKASGKPGQCPEYSSIVPRSMPNGCASKAMMARAPVPGCEYD